MWGVTCFCVCILGGGLSGDMSLCVWAFPCVQECVCVQGCVEEASV